MIQHSLGRVVMLDNWPLAWFSETPNLEHLQINGIHNWAIALGADHPKLDECTIELLGQYDLIFANLEPQYLEKYAGWMRDLPKNIRWVSLIESDISLYTNPSLALVEVLRKSDLVISINEFTVPYLQCLAKTRVENLGVPYPFESIASLIGPETVKRDAVLCTVRENQGPSIVAITEAGLAGVVKVPKASRTRANLPMFIERRSFSKHLFAEINSETYDNADLSFEIEISNTMDFLRFASQFRAWIHLDPRMTWARSVLDGAALGIPVVASRNTVHASDLFPMFAVDTPYDSMTAAKHLSRIFAEPDFVKESCQKANQKLHELYGAKTLVRKLEQAL